MPTHLFRWRQKGVSMVIVLIMLIVIGLTSAAAIRNTTSSERLTNNLRVQNLAQQYAEAALRFCETEIAKADASRTSSLREANIVATAFGATAAWNQTVTWTGTGGASASMTSVPESQIYSSDSSFKPSVLPQCVVEKQSLPDGSQSYVITARGFSPDYVADGSGKTTQGSVVWLQSTVFMN